ncbi:MAG: UDP-N-acetylglucosamine 1-carboxyvinyltransferase [Clostridiales Family XIII bacterium]|jgi:UDP-N-acetylglucosamine 1-carboxyvinyltransferase|nr:UDP-N-acetylglucosamine 1-carboxyvinyltransferase [Clostridiales Family XIII bacterium]
MAAIIVEKSDRLEGTVQASGSKNAVLPLLAATLLTDEPCVLGGVPVLKDVEVMCRLLGCLGAEVEGDRAAAQIRVRAKAIRTNVAPPELVKSMRASIVAMGPLLARTGGAGVPLPGGCAIGDRPIDLHIKGFRSLGAKVETGQDENGGFVSAEARRLKGAEMYLDFASVGATENIMMAAALAEGTTIIENPAQEPEIVDLANFLNKMGARIRGAGTDMIRIEGVEKLHGAEHSVIPDRIEAGTFMLAAAITRGSVLVDNMLPNHVVPIIAKLRETGVYVREEFGGLRIDATRGTLRATDIKTLPYPGFPTDIQPQFMAYLATVLGSSTVIETVFENRFMHIDELNLMNAGIEEKGRRASVPGEAALRGARVRATDLRAGAALILAGLAAEGKTTVSDIYHIDRGYEDLTGKLKKLGAKISRL